jgi:hypothetical protein
MSDQKVRVRWTIQTTETFDNEFTVQEIADAIGQTPEAVALAIDAGTFGWEAFGVSDKGDDWLAENEDQSISDEYSVDERDIDTIAFM